MTHIRIRWKKLGGHYHCRVFTRPEDGNFAKCGDLVFDEREWPEIVRQLGMSATGVEFLDESQL